MYVYLVTIVNSYYKYICVYVMKTYTCTCTSIATYKCYQDNRYENPIMEHKESIK